MKHIFILLALSLVIFSCKEKEETTAVPSMKFHEDGTFKIAQITDTHYIPGNPDSKIIDTVISMIIETEKPDLVIFTGDQVTGHGAKICLEEEFSIVEKYGVPFIYTFGNHDREQDMTGPEMYNYARTFKGFMLNGRADSLCGTTYGYLPIISSKNDSTAEVIYIFDSGDYSTLKNKGVEGYGWITPGQIAWYNKLSQKYTIENGGKPVPSVAFFHIPLPEYKEAMAAGAKYIGISEENVCSPNMNSGLFTDMLMNGDIYATFVGHDHSNNYIVNWKGIALGYGNTSGGKTSYRSPNIPAGARIIELHEGKQELKTWVHQITGEVKDVYTIPTCFQDK